MKEIWKDIEGYEDYRISNLGRVKSLKYNKDRILSLNKDNKGYYCVRLWKYGKGKTYKVHKLVASNFNNHTPNGMKSIIDHKNDNKEDNKNINLRETDNRFNTIKGKRQKSKTSKYPGVSRSKGKYWQSHIQINGENVYLGTFKSEYDAHLVYQDKIKEIYGNCYIHFNG